MLQENSKTIIETSQNVEMKNSGDLLTISPKIKSNLRNDKSRRSTHALRFKDSSSQLSKSTFRINSILELTCLPDFLVTNEQFNSMTMPQINNFTVKKGKEDEKLK